MSKVDSSQLTVHSYKKILIVRMDRLGDVVLSTPAIKAVRDAHPESHIAVLVRPYVRGVLEGNPSIDEVITYDKTKDGKNIWTNIRFILNLRSKKFDLAIILHPKNSSHIFSFLAGIPERIGFDKKCGFLLTKKIPHMKQFGLKHEIDYTLDVLNYLGIRSSDRTLFLPLDKASERRIEDIFEKNGILKGGPVITMHPTASCPSRRWNLERFAKTADMLSVRYGAKIVIITGPEDKVSGDEVARRMKTWRLNLSGKTLVADLASILKRSRLLISNDSGPVHVAGAVGTPVVSIFGRNDRGISPMRWGPVGKGDVALHKDVGCEVCLAHNCKIGFKCLDAISVEEVLEAADRALSGK